MRELTVALSFVFLLFSSAAIARPTAKITVKAIDEQKSAIEGANVSVGFEIPNNSGIGTTEVQQKGITDSNGEFTASSGCMNSLGFHVDKEGYYQSGVGYEFKSSSLLLNRWEPWNPTIEVVLKKKRNPAAMVLGGTGGWVNVAKEDVPIGFDLEQGSWVAPYGKGTISDLAVTCHANVRAYADYDVSIDLAFANGPNGIQEYFFDGKDQSLYRWPFTAPIDGYKPTLHKELSKQIPGKGISTNAKKEVNYLFRVRSKVDAKGNLISANYGKINGEIGFDAGNDGGCRLLLNYVFNTDGSRNLEEDPKKNLFKMK
ncbi:MAG: hypothetical protein HGA96_17390 [Desulfobulbaceae bacterium]|nr:hypothetical protein [Desulfobulbaceae bacterium]